MFLPQTPLAEQTEAESSNDSVEPPPRSNEDQNSSNIHNNSRNREHEEDDEDDDDDDEESGRNKKANLDCSKYKGGSPKDRREMICYYYMRTQQLQAETQKIQQNTQALNQFKSQVWSGIKENQVPPMFFTNIQQNIQKTQSTNADYLSSFRLMYDISRIQSGHLTAHDRNRLKKIIQDTDQYIRSPNLDGYSHIQESVNILLNRMNIPVQSSPFL